MFFCCISGVLCRFSLSTAYIILKKKILKENYDFIEFYLFQYHLGNYCRNVYYFFMNVDDECVSGPYYMFLINN